MVDGLSKEELADAKRRERHQYPAMVVAHPEGGAVTEERWTEQTEQLMTKAMLDELHRQDANDDELSVGWYVARAGLAALAAAGLLVAPDIQSLPAGWHPDPEGSKQLTTTVQPEQNSMCEVLGRECKDLSVAGMSKLSQAMGALCGNDYEAALDIVSEMTEGDVDPGIAVMYTLIQMLMAVGTNYQLVKLAERDQRGLERTRQSGYAAWQKYPSAGEPS